MERAAFGFADGRAAWQDAGEILAAYFNAARFWRDVEHVMSLTIPELSIYLLHAKRLHDAERRGAE